jgi:hypothetical protein
MDYNARYYSALLGRFISPDTIIPDPTNPQSLNRYSYVYGNPVKFADPSDHCKPEECPGVPQIELTDELYEAYGFSTGIDRYYYGELVRQGLAREDAGKGGMAWIDSLDSAVAFDQSMVLMKEGPLDEMMYDQMIQTTAMAGGHLVNGASTLLAGGIVPVKYGGFGGGHHIHAKKAFEGNVKYDEYEALSISNKDMNANGLVHTKMTGVQQGLFRQLGTDVANGTKTNTMVEHNRIAVETLVTVGVPRSEARGIVAQSLWNLRSQGVRAPTHIPWVGPSSGTFK